jgi:hypothetical protein
MNIPDPSHATSAKDASADEAWIQIVADKIKSIQIGFIHIKVHEGQVVLIEATEQTKFNLHHKT